MIKENIQWEHRHRILWNWSRWIPCGKPDLSKSVSNTHQYLKVITYKEQ